MRHNATILTKNFLWKESLKTSSSTHLSKLPFPTYLKNDVEEGYNDWQSYLWSLIVKQNTSLVDLTPSLS